MARKRHSPESIAAVLRRVEAGIPIAELARKAGVHENTIHLWKKKYGQLGTAEIREINELRDENTRLKRLVADLTLDKVMLQDVLSKKALKPVRQRALAGEVQQHYGVSQRRTSMTLCFNRASLQYKPKRSPMNEVLRERIKELASARVRYGYRRIHVLLQREGWQVNPKRVARLYRQEGLSLRAKAPKRRRRSIAQRIRLAPTGPNQVWSMDFMHDHLRGDQPRKFRLLTIVDIFTRECLALEVAPGFRAAHVVQVLSRLVMTRGGPTAIRCDQGTEFTAEALDQWAYNNRIELDFSRPGKPTDNAFIESFYSSVRKELLNTSWFDTLEAARRAARSWRREYNEFRPHRIAGQQNAESLCRIGKNGELTRKYHNARWPSVGGKSSRPAWPEAHNSRWTSFWGSNPNPLNAGALSGHRYAFSSLGWRRLFIVMRRRERHDVGMTRFLSIDPRYLT